MEMCFCLQPINDWGTVIQILLSLVFGILATILTITSIKLVRRDKHKSEQINELKSQTQILSDLYQTILSTNEPNLSFIDYSNPSIENYLKIKNTGGDLYDLKCYFGGEIIALSLKDVPYGEYINVDLKGRDSFLIEFSYKDRFNKKYNQNLNP